MTSLLLDVVMIVMLGSVFKIAWDLNKNLKHFRQTESDLGPTIKTLSNMISQSSRNIDLIKSTARDVNSSLEKTIPVAESITDDLKYLIDHAERIAERLDHSCDKSRKAQNELMYTVDHIDKYQFDKKEKKIEEKVSPVISSIKNFNVEKNIIPTNDEREILMAIRGLR